MRQYFNPRSPHGERQAFSACLRRGCPYFNPRSPHGERPRRNRKSSRSSIFQSTPPHGERRQSLDTSSYHGHISIHAPRMGSDTPDGEHYDAVQRFQSTPPAWGATVRLYFPLNVRRISIHAPPAWGATKSAQLRQRRNLFQSTLPHGERQEEAAELIHAISFQSTLPHGERP